MPQGGGGATTDSTGGIITEGTSFSPGATSPLAAMLGFGADMELYTVQQPILASTVKQIFGLDPRRWGILISSTSTSIVTVGWDNKITPAIGVTIPAGGGFLWFNFDIHGILVTKPIFVISAAATTLYCVNIDFTR